MTKPIDDACDSFNCPLCGPGYSWAQTGDGPKECLAPQHNVHAARAAGFAEGLHAAAKYVDGWAEAAAYRAKVDGAEHEQYASVAVGIRALLPQESKGK